MDEALCGWRIQYEIRDVAYFALRNILIDYGDSIRKSDWGDEHITWSDTIVSTEHPEAVTSADQILDNSEWYFNTSTQLGDFLKPMPTISSGGAQWTAHNDVLQAEPPKSGDSARETAFESGCNMDDPGAQWTAYAAHDTHVQLSHTSHVDTNQWTADAAHDHGQTVLGTGNWWKMPGVQDYIRPSFDDYTDSAPSALVRGSCFGAMRPEIYDEFHLTPTTAYHRPFEADIAIDAPKTATNLAEQTQATKRRRPKGSPRDDMQCPRCWLKRRKVGVHVQESKETFTMLIKSSVLETRPCAQAARLRRYHPTFAFAHVLQMRQYSRNVSVDNIDVIDKT